MPTCCKSGSVESATMKSVIQGNVGTKLKSFARSFVLRQVVSIDDIISVGIP